MFDTTALECGCGCGRTHSAVAALNLTCLTENETARPCLIPLLDVAVVWPGWDLMDKCNLLSRLNAEGYDRPTQLDKRIHMGIHLIIEVTRRRANRRNGAA